MELLDIEWLDLDSFLVTLQRADGRIDRGLLQAERETVVAVAREAQRKARGGRRQLQAIAPSIRPVSDVRGSTVVAGGSGVATSTGATYGDLFFGANFETSLPNFPGTGKRGGSTIFPAMEELKDSIDGAFLDVIGKVWGARA